MCWSRSRMSREIGHIEQGRQRIGKQRGHERRSRILPRSTKGTFSPGCAAQVGIADQACGQGLKTTSSFLCSRHLSSRPELIEDSRGRSPRFSPRRCTSRYNSGWSPSPRCCRANKRRAGWVEVALSKPVSGRHEEDSAGLADQFTQYDPNRTGGGQRYEYAPRARDRDLSLDMMITERTTYDLRGIARYLASALRRYVYTLYRQSLLPIHSVDDHPDGEMTFKTSVPLN